MAFNFKKQEDVEAYLKNIYIEYKFSCEKEKDGSACHLLGDYMETIKSDSVEAAKIYKSNCDERNWPRSCAKYAGYRSLGKGCDADLSEGYKYMTKSCDLGDEIGCVKAGKMAIHQINKNEDDSTTQITRGIKMLEKACHEYNQEPGCFSLASVYLKGIKDIIEPNLSEAYKLSLKCCDFGNPYACGNISQMYARGEGIEKNESLAKLFKERALTLMRELKETRKQIEFGIGTNS